MIELSNITKSYAGHTALKNIDLFIQEGEIFGIIGKSGAGKSTLLRCINLLERPDSGSIVVDGEPLTELSLPALRQARHKIAMIFQHFNLLHSKTVYENIALPMRIQGIKEATIEEKIAELLPLVELEDKSQAYPSQLSGGQKQRVAIARALTCNPKILLCDEATSALDPNTTTAILNLLKKINRLYGITIVLITHEMDAVKQICHRRNMLYAQLSPQIPPCISSQLSTTPSNKPLLRLFFEGENATTPFISQTSRDLHLDITILLANIDRLDGVSCGVLVVELKADQTLLQAFITRCEQSNLTVEILGYVTDLTI